MAQTASRGFDVHLRDPIESRGAMLMGARIEWFPAGVLEEEPAVLILRDDRAVAVEARHQALLENCVSTVLGTRRFRGRLFGNDGAGSGFSGGHYKAENLPRAFARPFRAARIDSRWIGCIWSNTPPRLECRMVNHLKPTRPI